jgi:hypothetical protein
MKKFLVLFFSIASLIFLGMAYIANAAPVTPTYGGGLGTSTLPSLGSIPVGLNAAQYCVLPVGTNGQVPIASSTAPCGVAWGNVSGTSGGGSSTVNLTGSSTQGDVLYWLDTNGDVASSSNIFDSSSTGYVAVGGNTDGLAAFSGSSTIAWDYNDYLNAVSNLAFGTASTSIQISTTTGLAPSGLVQLNASEIAYYSSFTSAGTSSTLNGMTRGLFGTTKVSATGTVWADPQVIANSISNAPNYMVTCTTKTTCFFTWNGADPDNSAQPIIINGGTYVVGTFLGTSIRSVSGNYFTNTTAVPLTLQTGATATTTQFIILSSTSTCPNCIGIGEPSPSATLQVYGLNATTSPVAIFGNASNTDALVVASSADVSVDTTSTVANFNVNGTSWINGTSTFSSANASGSWNYSLLNDGNYLDIAVTGTIPGTNPVPYNIVRELCPSPATTSIAVTSSSWECDWGQSVTLPDGSTDFLDNNFQNYPTGTNPNADFGLFDNARGTSSQLFPFEVSFNNGVTNAVPLEISPTAGATSTSQFDALFNLGTNGQLVVGNSTNTTGDFVVNQNGASTCAGIYDSGASTIYGLTDSLPAPAGCTALGGYYKGLGIGGVTSGTGSPIFGVLNSSESSNGRGHTALTVYDTNEVDTFNNELDNGAGQAFFAGDVGAQNSSPAQAVDINASGSYGIAGFPIANASTAASDYYFGGAGNISATNTSTDQTAVGFGALSISTANVGATAVGFNSLASSTSGQNDAAFGMNSGHKITTGVNDTAIGSGSLGSDNTGGSNVGVGFGSLSNLTTGGSTVAVGASAGANDTGGSQDVFIGANAADSGPNTVIGSTTVVGYRAGFTLNTSVGDSLYGMNAGYDLTTGSNDIVLGTGSDLASTTSDTLNIGNTIYGSIPAILGTSTTPFATGTVSIDEQGGSATLNINGGLGFATSTVTVSSCGTNATSTGSNYVGAITLGTGGITSCTLNFTTSTKGWVFTPVPGANDSSSTDAVEVSSISTSTEVFSFPLSIAGGTIWYHNFGNPY